MNIEAVLEHWRNNLAQGHTETWLATFITVWAIGVVIFSWYLVAQNKSWVKYLLAGIILYEVLP